MQNQQWIYRQVPTKLVGPEHYQLHDAELSEQLAEDQVIVAARYISVDPYMRINQAKQQTWMDPHPLNAVQAAAVVGQVVHSASAQFQVGDWVQCYSGWQRLAKLHASALSKIDVQAAPAPSYLHALGMPGRTAWFGLHEAGRVKAGDVVVVSGAAGAVGSLVVQFAKQNGARVLAIAGSADKCAWLANELHADWTLNYKDFPDAASLSNAIKAQCAGVDVYFDNVGGRVSDAIWPLINRRARIIICGQISQYSGGLDQPELGPRLLHHLLYQRATVQGILARDYTHRMDEMLTAVASMVRSGEIISTQTIIEGFEQLPAALNQLFSDSGSIRGKLLVKI
jgi:NADPH-dependent curcumin reductase CurA